MRKNKFIGIGKLLISIFILIFIIKLALATPSSLNIQGKLTDSSGTIQKGTFNFTFRIYDGFTSGNKLYETNITSTTDARGIYDIILENINLSFDKQYYLGVKINRDSEMSPRINLTSIPYSFTSNQSKGFGLFAIIGQKHAPEEEIPIGAGKVEETPVLKEPEEEFKISDYIGIKVILGLLMALLLIIFLSVLVYNRLAEEWKLHKMVDRLYYLISQTEHYIYVNDPHKALDTYKELYLLYVKLINTDISNDSKMDMYEKIMQIHNEIDERYRKKIVR